MFKKGRFLPIGICSVEGDEGAGGGGDLSKMLESFKNKLAKHDNDATAFATQLYAENFGLREEKRKLGAQIQDLQGRVPTDGSVVLNGDDAKAWNSIKELNLSPEQIKEKLQTSDEANSQLAELRRKDLMREVSEVEGYKSSVLSTLIPADTQIEIKEAETDGKKHRAAFVKVKENGADKEYALSEYVESNHKDFLPALKAEQVNTNTFVRQDSKGRAPSANPYDQIRQQAKERQEAQKKDSKPLDQRLGMASQ